MKKISFLLLLLILFLFPLQKSFAQNYFCALYFSFIGCPNCAVTDPIVLIDWTKKYSNLVIIEYVWHAGEWEHPNSKFFGKYTKAYKSQPAVPQLVFNKSHLKVGRIEVPKGENYIESKKINFCPLIDKLIPFEKVNLNELPASPKIWANGRVLIKLNEKEWLLQWNGQPPPKIPGKETFTQKEVKELLFTENLSEKLRNKAFNVAKPQKVEFSGIAFPNSGFVPYAEFKNAIKITLKETNLDSELETFPESSSLSETSSEWEGETIDLPLFGKIETKKLSLPILTFLIALADGFNPCAFFVLTFLLATLIGLTGARRKILLVGGIFIFISALFYFLFMSILLNVFQLGKKITLLTLIAGIIAVGAGVINIKDYFFFQKGISLTLPKSKKEQFFQKLKNLSLAKSTLALIITTSIIASTVNIYELLCTFGFPMIYTRILTFKNLSPFTYYLYLILYNCIYVIPLGVIVLIFTITLGKKTFSQLWIRRLKLVSGLMILFLGLILLLKPKLLESIFTAIFALFGALITSLFVILIHSLFLKRKGKDIEN